MSNFIYALKSRQSLPLAQNENGQGGMLKVFTKKKNWKNIVCPAAANCRQSFHQLAGFLIKLWPERLASRNSNASCFFFKKYKYEYRWTRYCSKHLSSQNNK